MIDMSAWEEMVVDVVNDLHLDPRNVRLDIPDGVPESDIVQDLFTNEKALKLVEGIAKVGLLTHEIPIVVERDGQLIVVEGNRRVAALKAIQNPYLAPEHQARISKFAQLVPSRDAVRRITVKKAPSQDDADQLIAALHTGNQRVAWTPARQAAFFQAQLDAGKSPDHLIAQYPTVDVRKFITRSRILELFRNVSYDDPTLGDYARKRRFPVSTLARLYANDMFLDLVGIQVKNGTGEVSLLSSAASFKRVATKIVSDIRDRKINTRSLNMTSSDRYVEYMDELRDLLNEKHLECDTYTDGQPRDVSTSQPNSRQGTGGDRPGEGAGSAVSGEDQSNEPSDTGRVKAKPFPKKRNYLNTDNLTVPPAFPASIHEIVKELSAINIQRFPNATLDLLRTFLEKTIKAYAEALGEDIRKGSNEKGFVFLSNCLVWLEDHFRTTGMTALIQPVQKVRGGRYGFVGSKEHLDSTNHNHHIFATPDDVRESWATIEGIMKAVLKP
ncbi:hypothetical protein HMPREF0183_0049 [Brevibacterium mcbrellneri ATCC 49030]|uniref:ParB/Sulfiredoxin domain-containing protein n=1 Tax=Brevibacterium mcbrellneri ATCC 49030 TaxID=585530 RepID=D4YJD9_9MICO|nr:hypothetical protein [Brevibacterium mcbrellneri]EFG48695.1 hypothetical protein HMPREF0183_0049 [Brevibacterium mcbrellneri ATCC 49030]